MKQSTKAWEMAAPIYGAIIQHPFNQELMKGTLAQEKFIYYIEQDTLFLKDLATCFKLIASKIRPEYSSTFLQYADTADKVSEEIVRRYFKEERDIENDGRLSRATLSYTSYLLRMAAVESVELAVAAILPSFWVYRESHALIANGSAANNPYSSWIDTFISKDFSAQVDTAIDIFDALAEKASPEIRQKMLEAFSKSTMLEWHFWNDVYEAIVFDTV